MMYNIGRPIVTNVDGDALFPDYFGGRLDVFLCVSSAVGQLSIDMYEGDPPTTSSCISIAIPEALEYGTAMQITGTASLGTINALAMVKWMWFWRSTGLEVVVWIAEWNWRFVSGLKVVVWSISGYDVVLKVY